MLGLWVHKSLAITFEQSDSAKTDVRLVRMWLVTPNVL